MPVLVIDADYSNWHNCILLQQHLVDDQESKIYLSLCHLNLRCIFNFAFCLLNSSYFSLYHLQVLSWNRQHQSSWGSSGWNRFSLNRIAWPNQVSTASFVHCTLAVYTEQKNEASNEALNVGWRFTACANCLDSESQARWFCTKTCQWGASASAGGDWDSSDSLKSSASGPQGPAGAGHASRPDAGRRG